MSSIFFLLCSCALSGLGRAETADDAVDRQVEALKSCRWPSQAEAVAETLGRLKDPWAVESLLTLLKEEGWQVRRAAAAALGEIGDPRAVAALIEALKDPDSGVRQNAAYALGQLGAPAVEPLIGPQGQQPRSPHGAAHAWARPETAGGRAADRGPQGCRWKLREEAADALGQINDVRAVEPLIAVVKDKKNAVQSNAARRWARSRTGGQSSR